MTSSPSRRAAPHGHPAHASFLPGFWLLVPGALGLIGLTELAGGGGVQDLVATVGSIFAVALGVLCGTQLLVWAAVTGRDHHGRVGHTLAEARRAPMARSADRRDRLVLASDVVRASHRRRRPALR